MPAEKNQRYLLLQADSRVCGINLMKLMKLIKPEGAVDWENQPLHPFDLSVNLPLEHMHVLDFDSKIVLVGGCKFYFKFDEHRGPTEHFKTVYELDLEEERAVESKSIEDAKFYFDSMDDHHLKIGTDYYFIIMDHVRPMGYDYNFNVLRSGTNAWECSPEAPDDPFPGVLFPACGPIVEYSLFDFYGILYLRMRMLDGSLVVFTYNTHIPLMDWSRTLGDHNFTRSFSVKAASDGKRLFIPPALRIPDFVAPGKYLALSCECIGGKHTIFAFLVDEMGVLIYQRLEGLLDWVPPSFTYKKLPRLVNFGGKGNIGVLLPLLRKEKDPVLGVLVLKVDPNEVINYPTRIMRRSVRSPPECEFLGLKVLGVHMYSMDGIHEWRPAFVYPNIQCHQENAQEVPRLGKRNWSKI